MVQEYQPRRFFNSCSLKHDGRDLVIRKMLIDSGIEPWEPAKDDSAAS